MKNRSTLLLMEQVIMVMFFSIAAILCIQIFVYAHRTSIRNTMRMEAAETVQSVAEELKSVQGDYDALMKAHGAVWNGDALEIGDGDTGYVVCVTPLAGGSELMGAAEVSAVAGEDKLIAVNIGWQEAVQ